MSAYLAYKYSKNLDKEKRKKIDQQVIKNRSEFVKGFKKGSAISLTAYLLVAPLPVYTSDVNPDVCPKGPTPELAYKRIKTKCKIYF